MRVAARMMSVARRAGFVMSMGGNAAAGVRGKHAGSDVRNEYAGLLAAD